MAKRESRVKQMLAAATALRVSPAVGVRRFRSAAPYFTVGEVREMSKKKSNRIEVSR